MSEELKKVSKEEIEFNKLQAKVNDAVTRAGSLKIYDATTLAIATQVLSEVKGIHDAVEAKRVELKEPFLEGGKEVDRLAKTHLTPLKNALDKGRGAIMSYNMEQQKKAEEKQKALEAIRIQIGNYSKTTMIAIDHAKNEKELKDIYEKNIKVFPGIEKWGELLEEANTMRSNLVHYIKAAKIALLTPEQADEEVKTVIQEVAQKQVSTAGQDKIEAAAFTSSTKFRDSPMKFRLIDATSVPQDWWVIDEDKVKAFMKEHKDFLKPGDKIHGFEFYKEQSVVIK